MSIRLRLTLWLTALIAVVLTGLTVLVYTVVAEQMENRLDSTLRERTADIRTDKDGDHSPGRYDREECQPGETTIAGLDTFSETLYAEQYDECGNIAARSSNLSASLPIPARVAASTRIARWASFVCCSSRAARLTVSPMQV